MTPEAIGVILATITATTGIIISFIVYLGQKKLSKRQFIIPLWEHMTSLNDLNPSEIVIPHVIKTVNTLELIAISCEGKMIDEAIIIRSYAHQFVYNFETVQKCPTMPALNNKSGQDLLNECPAVIAFYNKIKQHLINLTKIK